MWRYFEVALHTNDESGWGEGKGEGWGLWGEVGKCEEGLGGVGKERKGFDELEGARKYGEGVGRDGEKKKEVRKYEEGMRRVGKGREGM